MKKKLIIGAIVLVLIAAAIWYFGMRDRENADAAASTTEAAGTSSAAGSARRTKVSIPTEDAAKIESALGF